MSAWSLKFKNRMMQLETAIRDPETEKVYLITDKIKSQYGHRPIHRDIYDSMNEDRVSNGLHALDLPDDTCFDEWEGRGFQHKFTKDFMQANEASNWASSTGYEQDEWCGESLALRRKQETIREES